MSREIFETFDDDSILAECVIRLLLSCSEIATLSMPDEARNEIGNLLIATGEVFKEFNRVPGN